MRFALVWVALSCLFGNAAKNPWADVRTPSQGRLGAVGFYTGGCLDGAQTLPIDGRGYQVMRLSRNRYYGHRRLAEFIRQFSSSSLDHHIGVLLFGDLSQPRGGPMPTGHVSHEIGLDVDIWFLIYPDAQTRRLTLEERERVPMVSFVNLDRGEVRRDLWTQAQVQMLKLAANHPDVERIFVNPAIKLELCRTISPQDRAWLHILRPWFGHDEHFHVRLKCPVGAINCVAQPGPPPGDGCDDLSWWLTPEARARDVTSAGGDFEDNQMGQTLPPLCDGVLKSKL